MFRRISLAMVLVSVATTCWGAPIFYASRAAFDAANPGLPTETFEEAVGGTQQFTGPLNSSTSNAFYSAGDILPGISFDSVPTTTNNVFNSAPGHNGTSQTTKAFGSNQPGSASFELTFSAAVNAVAMDLFQNHGGGFQSGLTNSTIDVFGSSGLLGSIVVGIPTNGVGFFGVNTGSDAITRIVITNSSNSFEIVDNVSFGLAAAEVPEPASLALWSLGAIGLLVARRRMKK